MSLPSAISDCRLVGSALLVFTKIAKAWTLTEAAQSSILGQPIDAALAAMKESVVDELHPDTLERIGYAIGICPALHTLFPSCQQTDSWLRGSNEAALVGGGSASALLCSGRLVDLAAARRYLGAQGLGELWRAGGHSPLPTIGLI